MNTTESLLFFIEKDRQLTILGRVRLLYDFFQDTIDDDENLLNKYGSYYGESERRGNEDTIKRLGRALRQRYSKTYVRKTDSEDKERYVIECLKHI